MKLDLTLGCSICGVKHQISVSLPFSCDDLECPRCNGCNCLSILSASKNSYPELPIPFSLKELEKLRQL